MKISYKIFKNDKGFKFPNYSLILALNIKVIKAFHDAFGKSTIENGTFDHIEKIITYYMLEFDMELGFIWSKYFTSCQWFKRVELFLCERSGQRDVYSLIKSLQDGVEDLLP